jgi:hypothetical protein
MSQTAVEWLVEQLLLHHIKIDIKNTVVYQQAKAMEMEQMIEFTNNYLRQVYEVGEMTIEDFYNETYGGNK